MLPSFIKMLRSFRYAGRGIYFALRRENNFRYHLLATVSTLLTGWLTGFTRTEWCIVLMLIGMVYASEIFNTAIEKLLDKLHPDFDPEVGAVKDLAAGAVLVTSVTAAIVGSIILLGKLGYL
ncbi:MAG: diacylglycerol kinase family protein [Tunicatimonas sp.]